MITTFAYLVSSATTLQWHFFSISLLSLRMHMLFSLQGRKVKRHRRLFKKQGTAAPVGRDSMAKEFGIVDELADLEGSMSTCIW
jgi:hypothetical protein